MNATEVETLLKEAGALRSGHFRLSSGLHSDRYCQCALLLRDPAAARRLGDALASLLPSEPRPASVVSPALGGMIIGHETARSLGTRFQFTERKDGAMTLRRGFSFAPGEKVLVVEDVLTTGKSSREVLAVLRDAGADPIAVASIVNRGCGEDSMGVPVHSLLALPLTAHRLEDCPLCGDGVPVEKPGSREAPKC